ncbi:hypothetical protein [Polaromonas sp. CF318]|uniref:hypothetical protein n=1 Tax=Polaromonas sp. CF318 TaxID=1144318 RepID=UPI0012F891FF|nr:hypothetical protein [Polaromonas sp. CF318]
MKHRYVLVVVAVLLAIGLLWYLLPATNCCEKVDSEYLTHDLLVGRALKGDHMAERELYDAAANAGHHEGAHQWAMTGALSGNPDLTQIYIQIYKKSSKELQAADEIVIKKNLNRDGVPRLASLLGISIDDVKANSEESKK